MLILTGASPASSAASIPSSTLRDREVDPVHRPEDRVVERVEADRHPLQPGRRRAARPGARSAEPLVVSVRSTGRPSGRRIAASIAMRSGRSRRTSGSPPVIRSFSTPSPTKTRASRVDLLEGQHLVARQERVVPPEDLLGHAVRAPEVAPVGDRDAQVAHRPAERVGRPGRPSKSSAHPSTHGSPVCASEPRSWRRTVAAKAEPRTGASAPKVRERGRRRQRRIGRPRHALCPPATTAVPPAWATGTTSQLHRTNPRCHDALSPRTSGRPA